jgi:hypothetical protein
LEESLGERKDSQRDGTVEKREKGRGGMTLQKSTQPDRADIDHFIS